MKKRLVLTAATCLLAGAIAALPAAHAHRSPRLSDGDPVRGRAAFSDLRCHSCHRVAEDPSMANSPGAWDGPLLHDLGKEPAEAVAWRIVTRTNVDAEGIYDTPMAEAASAMTERQLVDLVAYLRNPRAGRR